MAFKDVPVQFTNPSDNSVQIVKKVYKASVAVDPASLNANTSAETDVTVPGAESGDMIFVNVPASLEAGLAFSGVRIHTDNVVKLRLSNVTASPVDGASRTWVFYVVKFGTL